jgi:hypothetical protein
VPQWTNEVPPEVDTGLDDGAADALAVMVA